MRVLLTGATGLIGSHVLARLRAEGAQIRAIARHPPKDGDASVSWIRLDLREATRPEDWLGHLQGVDAVVNCAGVLQDTRSDSTRATHHQAPAALFKACEMAGVRRVIHLSAIGVDRESLSAFSQTKLAGDEALSRLDLDWVILRPSVVVGRAAYGGSALFRGLAAQPLAFAPSGAGPLQIVQLDDLVETIVRFLRPDAPSKVAVEVAGPDRLAFEDVVATYRAWLGWRPALRLRPSRMVMEVAYRLGDFAGWLGWRPPIRSTARREMIRGAVGDPAEWTRLTGIVPQSLARALAAAPASVQERWFAKLYFLKAFVFVVFSSFWIVTALISFGPGYRIGVDLMREGGAGTLSGPSVIAGALADLLIGLGIAYRPTAKLALYGALALSLFYVVAGSILLPRLWAEPLGPLWKIWPILALNLVALAILDDR